MVNRHLSGQWDPAAETSEGSSQSRRDKVAIPRLATRGSGTRTRAQRACQSCRQRKTKCDGGKPSCQQCLGLGINCVYQPSQREKNDSMVEELKVENEEYKSLLRKVADVVTDHLAEEIQEKIANSGGGDKPPSPSSVGSLDSLDVVDEDFNRNEEARATGFIGKNSEISWLQGLRAETDRINTDTVPPGPDGDQNERLKWDDNTVASKTYQSNERPLVGPDLLNPYGRPMKPTADKFYDAYRNLVQPSFPIIRESLFSSQYQRYYSEPFLNPGDKWLSILNMILAIGARYSKMAGMHVDDGSDDSVYFARARSLSACEAMIFDHPDLQQVQLETLLAFYFMALSQVNRAWRMIRLASSSAISLGINMRSEDLQTEPISKEVRCRLWCSIFSLEQLLSSMTGRPSSLSGSFNAPLPFPEASFEESHVGQLLRDISAREELVNWTIFEDELETQARSQSLASTSTCQALRFFYEVDLSLITDAISRKLYGTHSVSEGWDNIEDVVRFYSKKLDCWLSTINNELKFHNNGHRASLSRDQVHLAMRYYSTCISLNRPCLSRPFPPKRNAIRFPRTRFGNDKALACVRSALSLLAIVPDEPDTDWYCTISPWWSMVHFIMQAVTVLLIQLAVGLVTARTEGGDDVEQVAVAPGMIEESGVTLSSCKKGLAWLRHMAQDSSASQKGFSLCYDLLVRIASVKNLYIDDVPVSSFWVPINPDVMEEPAMDLHDDLLLSDLAGTTDINGYLSVVESGRNPPDESK